MYNFLYPTKENILDLLNSDIHYKNYNTFDYINNLNNKNTIKFKNYLISINSVEPKDEYKSLSNNAKSGSEINNICGIE